MEIPLSHIHLDTYFHLAGVVILYYDYALTFCDEYTLVWKNPRSGPAVLFLLNRYFWFLSNIAMTVAKFTPFNSVESCQHYSTYRICSIIATTAVVSIIQALRTYALYDCDKRIALSMVFVALSTLGITIWAGTGPTPNVSLAIGCTIVSGHRTAIRYAITWEALFIWDSFIFMLTILKTYKERFRYKAVAHGNDLLSLISRDGAIYFAIMACVQCANSLTYYFCPPALIGTLSTLASSISVNMMSRLLLNLRRTAAMRQRHGMSAPGGYDLITTLGMMANGVGFVEMAGATAGDDAEAATAETSLATIAARRSDSTV